ncbi:MAG: tRNA (N6-isopentenyl adenosine(37)-C2)-methylthiotransferase MiaB [Lachnospiraceae bacterium]|nr:tRNA (N6-isopentenyl adenosine(37)-C2)-methylthiotransferase MiaB [Lachnospiraceae bacterium]MCM1239060.1 tRNA (N6-isopentenyl adenosine(37)-C2)-methylthiotransferase MiaB [Lachnospiraceae bacterium]MCM1304530.1 tRNA (N6-isopentenyl adenosine(37)-C2)-methylthiotransferase MiaB [Butyrivibrio sp.]MCM1345271.1 tRNA (N6-isopentenyl adenosine(37)-C2)-methylthiotransferase MiaB [Muribaculaceae bacterium]MCM1409632.1 tRNA (N6-isopentenyl adenosine(37)-C2)-methylthiotransferase MiaB [Lachnospiraceae
MYNVIDLDKIDINAQPPAEEPARQYYFMAKCREWVRVFEQKNGRVPTACVTTFGCQMNARDSEKLTGILRQAGYEITDSENADLVIFNTCTVRDNANQKVYGRLGELNGYKRKNPDMKIALCGCMMQEPTVIEKLKKSYPFVNLIFGTHNIFKFAELLCTVYENENNGMIIDIWQDTDKIVEDLPIERKYPFKSGINIMFGCNNFCSYCIVPYVRGRERSREPKDIIREIENLVQDGVVEVMLLGQNVNSYGKNLAEPMTFAQLLKEVEKIEGLKRIRFMTSHPKDLSDELIQVMKESKKICRHLHLPLQSGSTKILTRMNRRYTKEQYIELAVKIRREIPDIAITTDIIVGFPGETEADLEETLDVVRTVKYDNAFTFIYSKRTGTPAAAMEDQVPREQVKRGFDRLLKLVQDTAREQTAKYQGRVMEALIEEVNESDGSMVKGRLSNNTIVHLPGDASLVGKLVNVSLDECCGFYYIGHAVTPQGEAP